jgi:hypothetical protein
MLDPVECEQARVSRNRAYDGRFFTAVRTTGVYCRPVCPVRLARGCNVEFFPSAAAAEVAAIGPQIGYLFPVGNMQGYLNLKGYGEFDAANRPSLAL